MTNRGRRGFPVKPVVVTGTAAAALLVNLAGLVAGITVVLPHLLYVPIALAGYWYPRRGTLIAGGIAGVYAVMALALSPSDWLSIVSRAVTLVAIGTLIAYLSRQLAAQEERYRDLFDHSVAAIMVVDGDGVVVEANPRAAALVGRKELAGIPLAAISDDPDATAAFLSAAARRPADGVRLDLIHAERRPVFCLASAAPLGDDQILVTLADMTEERMAREALEAANQTMTTVAMILDHDLTGEVAALEACLDRGRETVDDPRTVALLRRVGEGVAAIARRIEVSREFRVLGTRPAVWQSVQDAVDEATARLDPGPVEVHSWVARLEVYADPALPVALYQLLHNATRLETDARSVVITYRRCPDGCRILVEDDGIGVGIEEREELFRPGAGRYGRGLFLAREILGITGIGISEEGAGAGARFVLSVPAGGCRIA